MRNLNQVFLDMSVRKKLFCGFGVVLAILVAISALSLQALSTLSERFTMLSQIKTISILVGEARQQEKNFMLRQDESYIQDANALIDQSIQIAEESLPAFTTSESIQLIQNLQNEARDYQNELKNYTQLEQDSQQRQQQMEQSARQALQVFNQMEQDFNSRAMSEVQRQGDQASIEALQLSLLASEAARTLLEARRLERTFVLTESQQDYQALQQELNQLDQLISQLQQTGINGGLGEQLTQATTQLNQYRSEFTEFRRLVDATNASEQQMTEQAQSVVAGAESSLERQLEQMQRQEQWLRWVVFGASALALLIGLTAALVITRLIVRPLQQVVAVADRIADGDLTTDLSSDRQDELGQLTNAMQRMTSSLRQLISRLSGGITQLASSTEEMAVISQQTSAGVSQQKVETEQVATAMNEMTATVQEVARSAEEASTAATESAEQAELGNQILDKTMSGIKQLAKDVNQSAVSIAELKDEADSIGSILDV
ncbi:MAG: methyl-accepting chemotaxis protein, partial [Alkalimonas sp.]|nr:methyl-accepting chemotaxis protein [Alkalimonas sp.]